MTRLLLVLVLVWTIPLAPNAPTFVVNAAHPSATDIDNPFGSVSQPRFTLPNPVPAGAVIDLVGPYATSQSSPHRLVVSGTVDRPIVIRSGSRSNPGVVLADWEVTGSFTRIEGLTFRYASLAIIAPSTSIHLRDLEMIGDGMNCHGMGFVSYDTADENSDIELRGSFIHDQGDVHADFDQDCHGLVIPARNHHIWVYDTEFARNSGDGIQINGGPNGQLLTHDLYIEGNRSHDNKQAGFWSKQASKVVFVRNKAWNHRPSNSSPGAGMGQQYGPVDVFYFENEIWNSDTGIRIASDEGTVNDGQRVFIEDNYIHDIHSTNPGDKADPWQPCGLSLQGIMQRFVIRNTIQNTDCGFAFNNNTKTPQFPKGQITSTYRNRALNVSRPVVGVFVERDAAFVEKIKLYYESQVH